MRRLQDRHDESVRTVQNQLLLLRRVPEIGVEERLEGKARRPEVRRVKQNCGFFMRGMLLLNRCIQQSGAGDGPTSVVIDFLKTIRIKHYILLTNNQEPQHNTGRSIPSSRLLDAPVQ